MHIFHRPEDISAFATATHQQGLTLGLVPTMGNLHAGHLSLVNTLRPLVSKLVVSIFVNPTQFGPHEDFARYPRTLAADCDLLEAAGVDAVFAPEASDMFQGKTFIQVPELSDILCGASRPGHFQGVATIVCKLLLLTQADQAIFGEKDYQQLMVIRAMARDLCLPVHIHSGKTLREPNGLAMSSRNQYLSEKERDLATSLYQALTDLAEQAQRSQHYETLCQHTINTLNKLGFKTDYCTIRRQQDLALPAPTDNKLIALAAATLGTTRLIDNLAFEV